MTRRSRQYAALLVIGICAALFACGLGATGVRQGAVRLPEFDIAFGDTRLIGAHSAMQRCTQLIHPGCVSEDGLPERELYIIWLAMRADTPGFATDTLRRVVAVDVTPEG
jgi:hypothetical protein